MSDSAPVPPSVQLGQVVPPEDPEDWRRPITWVVAAGMLAAPALAAVWFIIAPPPDPYASIPGTAVVAAVIAAGAAVTGASQRGAWRAVLGTLGAGLFSALGVVAAGSILAGGALSTAFVAAVAGSGGSLGAAALAGLLASAGPARRYFSPALTGGVAAVVLTEALFSL